MGEHLVIRGCVACPFFHARDLVSLFCQLRTAPSQVGQFPHFTADETAVMINERSALVADLDDEGRPRGTAALFAPAWCSLRRGLSLRLANG